MLVLLLTLASVCFPNVKSVSPQSEPLVLYFRGFFFRVLQTSPTSNLVSEFPFFLQKSSEASSSSPPSQADSSRQEVHILSVIPDLVTGHASSTADFPVVIIYDNCIFYLFITQHLDLHQKNIEAGELYSRDVIIKATDVCGRLAALICCVGDQMRA